MRLDRMIGHVTGESRRQVQEKIRKGQVGVGGVVVKDPGAEVKETDQISIMGRILDTRLTRHVMLYKPAGILTAARDRKQKTVMDLLPPVYASLACMPVGRLDRDTTGLLFLTTDGELSHRLLSPARHVDKCYRALVDGPVGEREVAMFREGLDLGDFVTQPSELEIEWSEEHAASCLLTIHEGKFHQVKRMFEKVGRTVTELHRMTFGPLRLSGAPCGRVLQAGEYRELTDDEIRALYEAVDLA
ncbi:MAG: rRNA pseudouridine synthase [Clostridia bacterium]|nr:rRNA pseudouridine synthase [Clostridia bacterium]